MKRTLLIWVVPALIAIAFWVYVITPPSYFNFLPYQLHELVMRGIGYEREFIILFDFIVACVLFFVLHKTLKMLLKKSS